MELLLFLTLPVILSLWSWFVAGANRMSADWIGFCAVLVIGCAAGWLMLWMFPGSFDWRFLKWLCLLGVLMHLVGSFPDSVIPLYDLIFCREQFPGSMARFLKGLAVGLVVGGCTFPAGLGLVNKIFPQAVDSLWAMESWPRSRLLVVVCADLALVLALYRVFDREREKELEFGGRERSSKYYMASRDGSFYAHLSRRATGEWRPPGRAAVRLSKLSYIFLLIVLVPSFDERNWLTGFWVFTGLLVVSMPVCLYFSESKH